MDIKALIVTAVEEIKLGVEEAKKHLEGKAVVGMPTKLEFEIGINSSYGIANYDDPQIAKVRVQVPIFESKPAEAPVKTEAKAEPTKKTTTKK